MRIFSGLFKSRDHPKNSYDSPSYTYFSVVPTAENESATEPLYSILPCMPVFECCQKQSHSFPCTSIVHGKRKRASTHAPLFTLLHEPTESGVTSSFFEKP